ncbi:MAG: hypothetical protein V7603_5112 [Micromonosporaceae bacterium]
MREQHDLLVLCALHHADFGSCCSTNIFSGAPFDAVGKRLRASGAAQVHGLVLARVPWA